jgi:hypothetical protein
LTRIEIYIQSAKATTIENPYMIRSLIIQASIAPSSTTTTTLSTTMLKKSSPARAQTEVKGNLLSIFSVCSFFYSNIL